MTFTLPTTAEIGDTRRTGIAGMATKDMEVHTAMVRIDRITTPVDILVERQTPETIGMALHTALSSHTLRSSRPPRALSRTTAPKLQRTSVLIPPATTISLRLAMDHLAVDGNVEWR
jgi:hypothetical protein